MERANTVSSPRVHNSARGGCVFHAAPRLLLRLLLVCVCVPVLHQRGGQGWPRRHAAALCGRHARAGEGHMHGRPHERTKRPALPYFIINSTHQHDPPRTLYNMHPARVCFCGLTRECTRGESAGCYGAMVSSAGVHHHEPTERGGPQHQPAGGTLGPLLALLAHKEKERERDTHTHRATATERQSDSDSDRDSDRDSDSDRERAVTGYRARG